MHEQLKKGGTNHGQSESDSDREERMECNIVCEEKNLEENSAISGGDYGREEKTWKKIVIPSTK